MNSDRKKRIAEIAWQRVAQESRGRMLDSLDAIFGDYTFLNKDESLHFGSRYWAKAGECEMVDPTKLDAILSEVKLDSSEWVFFLHRLTNDTGIVRVRLESICNSARQVMEIWGPDLLFAAEDLSFGVCSESGEDGEHLRWWK